MTLFEKRKKFDLHKFINRMKNRFQRVRKFCRMHTLPVLVAVGIMVSVIFASYQNAYATGLEEYFYYTYFDLMSGLFAETGSQFGLKDDYYTKSDRVSGKQVWDNFCTWVENKAKVAALPVEVVNKTVFDELKNLPNTVTSAGAKMSTQLSELLAKILPTFADATSNTGNFFDDSSFENYAKVIAGICGTAVASVPHYGHFGANSGYGGNAGESRSYLLNIVEYDNSYYIFEDSFYFENAFLKNGGFCVLEADWGRGGIYSIQFDLSARSYSGGIFFRPYPDTGCNWIIRNGSIVSTDGTSINDYAKVKKVDDNTVYVPGVGYKTNWDILKDILNDRVTTDAEEEAWNSRYNFDNDNKDDKEKKKKDNEKDKLPVAIPIIFPNKKPDSTEKDSEKDSEKGTEDVVPGGKPKPGSSEKPDSTQKDSEKDSESDSEKATDPSDIPPIADRAGNWKRLFPFCIPWDIMSLIKSMKAEKKAPVFEFEYTFKAVNYTWKIRIDMSDYWKYIKIFRWGMTIFFIIGLFFLTVKLTTFVYKMGS